MPKPKKLWQNFDINDKKEKCWWTLGILDMILLVEVQATTTTLQYEMVVYVKCRHTVLMVQTSGTICPLICGLFPVIPIIYKVLYIQLSRLALGFLNHPFPLNFAAQQLKEYVALVEGSVGIDEPGEGHLDFDGEKPCEMPKDV